MTDFEDCKTEGSVSSDYIRGAVKAGRGSNAKVTRMLVGMILRGETFAEPVEVHAKLPDSNFRKEEIERSEDDPEDE
jgi:hypothetical protein